MKISDLLMLSFQNLARRKSRTFLTVAGVMIGTCFLVLTIALEIGIHQAQDEMFQGLGDLSVINVHGASSGFGAGTLLDDAVVEQIQAMSHVLIATPFMEYQPPGSSFTLYAGHRNRYRRWASIIGVKPEALELLGYSIAEGAALGQTPSQRNTIQLICGDQFVYLFEDSKKRWPNNTVSYWSIEGIAPPEPFFDPLTANYQLMLPPSEDGKKTLSFDAQMVGMVASEEYEWEKRQSCFMDIADLQRIKQAYERENRIREEDAGYSLVKVKVDDVGHVSEVQEQIEAMGFLCDSMQQYRDQMQESTKQIQLILLALGGTSLFAAAVSIASIMMMAVSERTREIGIMKVVGCLVGNIRAIFLLEACLIGASGGTAGIGLGYLLAALFNTFGDQAGILLGLAGVDGNMALLVIPPWLALLGLLFAILTGLLAGMLPANRAVKISALEAIRVQ